ncbi:MAG TPA: AarF/ABC1/UbiB kinase family protein [Lacipirellulaceae bacterium]|jgi:predicted unusual protein kinase regulating ubiquinone biosynthesis (AarF/ABC1/UbiB family)|nr:AarF/ABC1/UbiB kinase family protein [Lacipirellulaceae bacterium]
MSTSIAELMAALPEEPADYESPAAGALPVAPPRVSFEPIPIGRFRRLTALGTLQAKIGAAYLFHWLRGWFKSAEENQRLLAETHWRTALRLLDSMSYLRGAAMKVGQTLANFPDIAPRQVVETLERLYYDVPPMHWSLLREMVHNELGDDPENLFAEFDKHAFAAASLGQVHRARLKTGEEVAVKIQYPGIARTIREDFRNLVPFLLPARLTKDWENVKDQLEDLRIRLEKETDYELEASNLEEARPLFREDDGIIVPRVFRQFSTSRLLTMERVDGVHVDVFLARGPSHQQRNEAARKILRAWYRMMYASRLYYADFHPGNFLLLDDGRVGVIDFGYVAHFPDDIWELMRKIDRPLTTGRQDDRVAAIREWMWAGDEPETSERMRLGDEFADWCWRPRYCGGEFDFSDEVFFRRGVDLFIEMTRKRYTRSRPITPTITRQQFGMWSMMYRLKAKIDIREIAEEEIKATGWDRSDYAA